MRVSRSRSFLFSVCVFLALAAAASPAMGQPWHSYAAKFVCGAKAIPPPASLAPDVYKTMVSIHNPNYMMDPAGLPVPALFYKKVVLTLPQGPAPLPPSCKVAEQLDADHALFMDCKTIKSLLITSGLPSAGGIEGFVVIEVPPQSFFGEDPPPPMDVVAVYAGRPSGGMMTTLDVERIPPTKVVGVPTGNPCNPD